eukprot:CAMPEP_0176000038 /NCGR_PEP_ID=MMETSP0108-20121206/57604_1 /TAXON_ID=195067 ORGANISM="Goniomonas pacifica, Strain CCMP1869" /NCGR_SAMPLE_ID=MMETSP0108 /ASSEMBLY_ACC=CAM_ASM_000204 /LENGTH=87 /DNA_ID=CAMNT_0017332505 /DNA_START=82 /DNA_END=346 /DNA_ORIENTATION=+
MGSQPRVPTKPPHSPTIPSWGSNVIDVDRQCVVGGVLPDRVVDHGHHNATEVGSGVPIEKPPWRGGVQVPGDRVLENRAAAGGEEGE